MSRKIMRIVTQTDQIEGGNTKTASDYYKSSNRHLL
jgi:hypothetical protein